VETPRLPARTGSTLNLGIYDEAGATTMGKIKIFNFPISLTALTADKWIRPFILRITFRDGSRAKWIIPKSVGETATIVKDDK